MASSLSHSPHIDRESAFANVQIFHRKMWKCWAFRMDNGLYFIVAYCIASFFAIWFVYVRSFRAWTTANPCLNFSVPLTLTFGENAHSMLNQLTSACYNYITLRQTSKLNWWKITLELNFLSLSLSRVRMYARVQNCAAHCMLVLFAASSTSSSEMEISGLWRWTVGWFTWSKSDYLTQRRR